MATTSHLNITLVETAQAQKEVTVNEAIARIDAVLNTSALSRNVSTPPGSPAAGDVYIVGSFATGDWASHENDISYFDQIWRFITPREGVLLWVADENKACIFDGSAWQVLGAGMQMLHIPAGGMLASSSGGASALSYAAMGAGKPDITYIAFDASTAESAEFSVRMPKRWNQGGGNIVLEWSHAATATDFDVKWNVQVLAYGDGDSLATNFSTADSITDTGGATDTLYKTAALNFSVYNSPAAFDTLYFRITRDAADGADTLAIDARLHGAAIHYYSDALTDD